MYFSFITNKWTQIQYQGNSPTPRWGHFATILSTKLYIFGGTDSLYTFNDLYAIPLEQNYNWEQINYGYETDTSQVFPRFNLVGFTINSVNFTVFGGINNTYVYQVYSSTSNNFNSITPTGIQPLSSVNVSGIITSQGIYIFNDQEWLFYQDGSCGDGRLAFYEECDGTEQTATNLCSYCYIDLCGNSKKDDYEMCDGGTYCTSDCMCPPTFYPDNSNGCYPETNIIAFYLMIFLPVSMVILMVVVIINHLRISPVPFSIIKEKISVTDSSKGLYLNNIYI